MLQCTKIQLNYCNAQNAASRACRGSITDGPESHRALAGCLIGKLVMQLRNVLARDFAEKAPPDPWQDVKFGDALVLPSSARFTLWLDMLCEELVEHGAKTLISPRLVTVACCHGRLRDRAQGQLHRVSA
jgi:hypothetical protein